MKNDEWANQTLLDLSKTQTAQAWIGVNPPFEKDIVDISNSSNFRVAPNFHQKYKIVWMFETLLSQFHPWSWRIMLDEVVRLLGREGVLVIRTIENAEITIPLIKNYLGRMFDLECAVRFEHKYENLIWVLAFDIKRFNIEKYSAKNWTFGILTGGKKIDVVCEFLKSIRKFDSEKKHQIVICGPKNSAYEKYNVEYLDTAFFRDDEYAEISKKKNAIAQIAKNENLLLAHDRYVLDENFFCGFEKYGYDFSFVTTKQFYKDKTIYPFYCALPEGPLLWRNPIQVDNYNLLYPNAYLNGGLLIFKTHILQNLKFNSLLMWNQMEDGEIAKIFREHSLVPRANLFSSATTFAEKSKTAFFDVENLDASCYTPWGYRPATFPNSVREEAEQIYFSKKRRLIRKFTRLIPEPIKQGRLYKKIREKILSRHRKRK